MPQETFFNSTSSQQTAEQEAKKRKKRVVVMAMQVLYLLIIALTLIVLINKNTTTRSIEAFNFQEAVAAFKRIPLGGVMFPKDSAYIAAAQLMVDKKFDEAAAAFGKLTDDPRAEVAVSEAKYQKAVYAFTSGDFKAASSAFKDAGEYRDSVLMEKESRCQLAAKFVAETEYDQSFLILQKLLREKYEPATQQMYLAYSSKAELFASKGNYAEGFEVLLKAEKYGDISAQLPRFQENAYQEAITLYREGKTNKAKLVFSKLGDYLQAKDYQLLIKARDTGNDYRILIDKDMKNLKSLIGFEDTAELLVEYDSIATDFLMGEWNGNGFHFSIREEKDAIYVGFNLPAYDFGDYYVFEGGRMLAYLENAYDFKKPFFSFTVISEDCIEIYAYNGGETYKLYRD